MIRNQFLKIAAFVFLSLPVAAPASSQEQKPQGCKWGAQIISADAARVEVKLMMMTGNCGTPPMTCDASGNCQSQPFACGTAHDIISVSAKTDGQVYEVGREIDVWIDEAGPTFEMNDCLKRD